MGQVRKPSLPRAVRALRFGVRDAERFSQHWKVSAARARPELVLSGNRTGRFLHLTMHEDASFWHIKVTLPDEIIERPWEPPQDALPGVRRLVRLLLPLHAVRYPPPPRAERVTWYPGPADDATWTEFTVLHCRHGVPAIRNADVLGNLLLADGSEAVVIARLSPAEPGSATLPAPDPEQARRLLAGKDLGLILHGTEADGCIWLLNLFSTARP